LVGLVAGDAHVEHAVGRVVDRLLDAAVSPGHIDLAQDLLGGPGDEGHEGDVFLVVGDQDDPVLGVVAKLIGPALAASGDGVDHLALLQVDHFSSAVPVTGPELLGLGDDQYAVRAVQGGAAPHTG